MDSDDASLVRELEALMLCRRDCPMMKPRSSEQWVEGCLDIEHVELRHETKWTHLKFKGQLAPGSPLGVVVGSYRRRRRSDERFLQSESMERRERTYVECSSGIDQRLRDRVIFEDDGDVESFDVGPIDPFWCISFCEGESVD